MSDPRLAVPGREGARVPPTGGLSEAEVEDRRRAGLTNRTDARSSRTVAEILRSNLLTRFNALLGGLLLVIFVIGPPQDALFGVVLVSNAVIGIAQELRAKRTLDRLALQADPRVRVLRDDAVTTVASDDVVRDDVFELATGDAVALDGRVLSGSVDVDESLLTGESEHMTRLAGDPVRSGSIVVAGYAWCQAVEVGPEAFASRILQEARRFAMAPSELMSGINHILRLVTWAILPAAAVLVGSQLQSLPFIDAVRASVAGVGAMVPEGLVLLTSIAFGVAALRLARRRVLVRELPAVEGLARVDVVCLDKTGTLTLGDLAVADLVPVAAGADGDAGTGEALGALAAADPAPNASLRAIALSFPTPEGWTASTAVPFSSARRWSAATFPGRGTWYLGAPELLAADYPAIAGQAAEIAGSGRRVLLVASGPEPEGEELPGPLQPAALVLLEEQMRVEAAGTIRYFLDQGVDVRVLSGDHPATVAAVARRAGVPGAERPLDAARLPADPADLAGVLAEHSVIGRIGPEQKRDVVAALQSQGRVVAMTGDGANDVLALKQADVGVAMGSGTSATRAVAQLVLLDGDFAALPPAVAEGRRVIANVERVANLFLTKTVYALALALAVGAAGVAFPFLPRHLTIISSLTIGIPGFFLALAPNAQRFRPRFVGRVLRFAVPAGLVAAMATFAGYAEAREQSSVSLGQARTVATFVLLGTGLWVLSILARPLTAWRAGLVAAMAALFVAAVAWPSFRHYFALQLPPAPALLGSLGIIALAGAALEAGEWAVRRSRVLMAGSPVGEK